LYILFLLGDAYEYDVFYGNGYDDGEYDDDVNVFWAYLIYLSENKLDKIEIKM
jgi:hypothetical protein